MRPVLRIRKLAIQGLLPRTYPHRLESTWTSSISSEPSSSSTSSGNPPKHQIPPHLSSIPDRAFFTPSHPSSSFGEPSIPLTPTRIQSIAANEIESLSPYEAYILRDLLPLIQRSLLDRDDILSSQVYKLYRDLPLSFRRSLPPTIHKTILRYVVPSRSHLQNMIKNSINPIAFRRSQAARMERRLQKVILDMRKSTRAGRGLDGIMLPHWSEYRFAMKRLALQGWLEGCQGIYNEVLPLIQLEEDPIQQKEIEQNFLHSKVVCMKNWLTNNTIHDVINRNGTKHTPFRVVKNSPKTGGDGEGIVEYKLTKVEPREPKNAEDVVSMVEKLNSQLIENGIMKTGTMDEFLSTVRKAIDFLPENDETNRKPLLQLLETTLKRIYDIDLKYFQIGGKGLCRAENNLEVIHAVVSLLGARGDVWRMLAAYETLTLRYKDIGDQSDRMLEDDDGDENWDDDIGETLTSKIVEEKKSSHNLDWLGRSVGELDTRGTAEIGVVYGDHQVVVCSEPVDLEVDASSSSSTSVPKDDAINFNAFLSPIPNPSEILQSINSPQSSTYLPANRTQLANTQIYTTMLQHVLHFGPTHLGFHILRSALRRTAEARTQLLESVLVASSSDDIQQLPSYPQIVTSATWFKLVHSSARKESHSIHFALQVSLLAQLEMESLQEEYRVLTGRPMPLNAEKVQAELNGKESPIEKFTPPEYEGDFDIKIYLNHLTKTHWCLNELVNLTTAQRVTRTEAIRRRNQNRLLRSQVKAEEAKKIEMEKAERKANAHARSRSREGDKSELIKDKNVIEQFESVSIA